MKSNNFTYNANLDDAANAIAADDRDQARGCIELVLAETSDCAEAWLIKAWACESLQETEIAIQQSLEIDPSNEIAAAGLRWIHGIQELAEFQFEAKRQAEEARLRAEAEAKRQEEERRQAEEARLRAEEAQRQAEEARHQAEEARQDAEAEAKRQAEAEQARLQAEEQARNQVEEARRWAEEEAQFNAELEKQEELVRQAKTKAEAEANRQAELAQERDLSFQENAGDCDEVEAELKNSVDSLASEVRLEIQSNPGNAAIPINAGSTKIPLVLAVDDSPTVRKLVSLTLASDGFEVVTAADGVEALNILAERLPDIILSDINMPKLNGYKLCKFVKKHERTRSIPVVMLSGNDGVFDKMRGKMSGCDDFIAKPFESAELVAKVREILTAATSR